MSKEQYRVIVAGTRDFNDYQLLCEKCDKILANKAKDSEITIVSGTAKGADRLGERYAKERGYRIERYPADWDRDGNKAGPLRNIEMAKNADALIAFWDGQSRGTRHMIDTALDEELSVRIINYAEIHEKAKLDALLHQTSQYAIEHITGKGMHTGILWLQDSFSEYCDAMGVKAYEGNRLPFMIDDIIDFLAKEPWVNDIAAKSSANRTQKDINKLRKAVANYWSYEPSEIEDADIECVLHVADPHSHRHILAQKVAIDCIHALNHEQLQQLDKILDDLAKNPKYGQQVAM